MLLTSWMRLKLKIYYDYDYDHFDVPTRCTSVLLTNKMRSMRRERGKRGGERIQKGQKGESGVSENLGKGRCTVPSSSGEGREGREHPEVQSPLFPSLPFRLSPLPSVPRLKNLVRYACIVARRSWGSTKSAEGMGWGGIKGWRCW